MMDQRTVDLLDAAMCGWEHVLMQLRMTDVDTETKWSKVCEDNGTATLREMVGEMAPAIDAAWRLAKQLGYDDCFDWDFVPRFLEVATDENCVLREDLLGITDRIVTDWKAELAAKRARA